MPNNPYLILLEFKSVSHLPARDAFSRNKRLALETSAKLITLFSELLAAILIRLPCVVLRKAALAGLPIEVIRGSETPVVCTISISEFSLESLNLV